MDYFDLKGIVEELLGDLHIGDLKFTTAENPHLHPGKSARIEAGGEELGWIGEVHPQVLKGYKFPDRPLPAAVLDLDATLAEVDLLFEVGAIPDQPPVFGVVRTSLSSPPTWRRLPRRPMVPA